MRLHEGHWATYSALWLRGAVGATDHELAAIHDQPLGTVSTRRHTLLAAGLVEPAGVRPGPSGRPCRAWKTTRRPWPQEDTP